MIKEFSTIMKRWQKLSYEFICIFSISLVIGVGIGWLQGAVAFRSLRDAESGVIIGGLFSIVIGPFVYYAFLRKYLTVKNAANLIMVCFSNGFIVCFNVWMDLFCYYTNRSLYGSTSNLEESN